MARPAQLSSIFPQGTALSQLPSIIHQHLHYKSQIEQSVRHDKEQSTKRKESEVPNKEIHLPYYTFFFIVYVVHQGVCFNGEILKPSGH